MRRNTTIPIPRPFLVVSFQPWVFWWRRLWYWGKHNPYPVDTYLFMRRMEGRSLDLPYEPMFDMPDYKTLGRTIATLVHSYPFDDAIPYDTELEDPLLEADSHLALPEIGTSELRLRF